MRAVPVDDQVLRGLLECLIIQYALGEEARTVRLVCSHWDRAPGSNYTFFRLRCEGATDFKRTTGERAVLQHFTTEYQLGPQLPPIVIEGVQPRLEHARKEIRFDLGTSFGSISFAFDSASGALRDARGIKVGEKEWDYFDFETGAPVSFYAPFADLSDPM